MRNFTYLFVKMRVTETLWTILMDYMNTLLNYRMLVVLIEFTTFHRIRESEISNIFNRIKSQSVGTDNIDYCHLQTIRDKEHMQCGKL